MDQPSPEPPPSETAPAPAAPADGAIAPVPAHTRDERIEARLAKLVGPDETITRWARAWVSREVRLQRLLGARTFDFAVLTDRALTLYSTGFFTRRPRRCVYTARLDLMFVKADETARARRLRISARGANPILVELGANERATTFADELTERARGEAP